MGLQEVARSLTLSWGHRSTPGLSASRLIQHEGKINPKVLWIGVRSLTLAKASLKIFEDYFSTIPNNIPRVTVLQLLFLGGLSLIEGDRKLLLLSHLHEHIR